MFSSLIERLAAALESAGIPYMLIGGQAVLLYGEPRLTRDIDVTLGLPPSDVDRLLSLAAGLSLDILAGRPAEFAAETSVLPCREPATAIRIDFIFSWSAYEQEALNRVNRVTLGATEVCFASPEDVVVHKIIAGRPRDLEDVRSILIKNPGLDLEDVRKWLTEFDASLSGAYGQTLEQMLEELRQD